MAGRQLTGQFCRGRAWEVRILLSTNGMIILYNGFEDFVGEGEKQYE